MDISGGSIKIFGCNGNKSLAEHIASDLGLALGKSEIGKFSDGEISVRINETVRGADVFIVQPTSNPVNDNLMELLITIDAVKRASAGRINAVIPYYGYARQDRKAKARDPISAKLVADLITSAGADRVITMDLHCAQIQGFFDIPVDHLVGMPLLSKYYEQVRTHKRQCKPKGAPYSLLGIDANLSAQLPDNRLTNSQSQPCALCKAVKFDKTSKDIADILRRNPASGIRHIKI